MKRGILYLAGMAATLYIALLYRSESFLMLFYLELVLPPVLLLFCVFLRRGMTVQLQLANPVVERGEYITVRIRVRSRCRLAGGRFVIRLKMQQAAGTDRGILTGRLPLQSLSEKREERGSFVIEGEYAPRFTGRGQVLVTQVWCYDCLGLIALPLFGRRHSSLKEEMLVLPEAVAVPVRVSRESREYAGESDTYSTRRGGDDPAEIFRIRRYQAGDRLRSIHWKLSAREEELMVRELSLPLGCPVLFFLDMQKRGKRTRPLKNWDEFLTVLFSVVCSIQREGCRLYVIWYDQVMQDIVRLRIETEEDVYRLLIQQGRSSIYNEPVELEELYLEKYHEAAYVTKLCLDLSLNLEKNGEHFCTYQRNHLKRQLQNRELCV